VTTLAGTGSYGNADGAGAVASFAYPSGVAIDGGNLYIADASNHKIRKIVISTGAVTTLAGSGTAGSVDATGTAASFNRPSGISSDGVNLYVTDESNHKIRQIVISTGAVAALAGSGIAGAVDATGTAASFNRPSGISSDGVNLYVSDTRNHKIRKIVLASGAVTTLAGSGTAGSVNATGAAASFTSPTGVTTDGINLYVADTGNHKIRKIVIASGAVSTWAGTGIAGVIDGTGASASFFYPFGIASAGGKLFVTDYIGHTIRKIQ
jgi:NHL repeat